MKPKIFISYCKLDFDRIKNIVKGLSQYEMDVWVDYEKLVAGDSWKQVILSEVSKCDAFIVFLSRHYNKVGFRQREVRAALDALSYRPFDGNFIIPVLLEECEIPDWCGEYHYICNKDESNTIKSILQGIECCIKRKISFSDVGIERLVLLRSLLKSDFSTDKVGALRSLKEFGESAAILLDDIGLLSIEDDSSVRRAAIDCLTSIGEPSISNLSKALMHRETDDRKNISDIINRLDPKGESIEGVNAMISVFDDESEKDVFEGDLGYHVTRHFKHYHKSIPKLIDYIADSNMSYRARRNAALAFLTIDPVKEDSFIELINHKNRECAEYLFGALHYYCFVTASPDKPSVPAQRFKNVLKKVIEMDFHNALISGAQKALLDIETVTGMSLEEMNQYY